MTRAELDQEIRETNITLRHLAAIGETETAAQVARYLDQLIATRDKLPHLRLIKQE